MSEASSAPDNLIKAREAVAQKKMSDAELQKIQEAAIRDVVRMQEELGLKVVTDGEYNRGSWQRDFLVEFDNVALVPSKISVKFHTAEGARENAPPSMQVQGKIGHSHPIFVDDFKFLKVSPRRRRRSRFPRRARCMSTAGSSGRRQAPIRSSTSFYHRSGRRLTRRNRTVSHALGCRFTSSSTSSSRLPVRPVAARRRASSRRGPRYTRPKTYATRLVEFGQARPDDMAGSIHLCRGNIGVAWVAGRL